MRRVDIGRLCLFGRFAFGAVLPFGALRFLGRFAFRALRN